MIQTVKVYNVGCIVSTFWVEILDLYKDITTNYLYMGDKRKLFEK